MARATTGTAAPASAGTTDVRTGRAARRTEVVDAAARVGSDDCAATAVAYAAGFTGVATVGTDALAIARADIV